MERLTTPDGETVFVADDEAVRGSKDLFRAVFADDARDERWGWFCANCESLATAVDTMGRIECTECANVSQAEEWDAAHE